MSKKASKTQSAVAPGSGSATGASMPTAKRRPKRKRNSARQPYGYVYHMPERSLSQFGLLADGATGDLKTEVLEEFERVDTTNFVVVCSDILTEFDILGSYLVAWIMPGGGADARGNLHKSGEITVTAKNMSPFTIHFRAQRPLGFEDDPRSVALWEPAWKKKTVHDLLPGKAVSVQLEQHAFGGVGRTALRPRLIDISGKLCVHAFSFAVSREIASEAGVLYKPGTSGLHEMEGLEFTVSVKYISTGAMQDTNFAAYSLQRYHDTSHMDYINTCPSIPVSVGDLRVQSGEVFAVEATFASVPAADQPFVLRFWSYSSQDAEKFEHAEGMDKGSIYVVPGVVGHRYGRPKIDPFAGRYVIWVDQSVWKKAGFTDEKTYYSSWYVFSDMPSGPNGPVSSLTAEATTGWSAAQCTGVITGYLLQSIGGSTSCGQNYTSADYFYPQRALALPPKQKQVCVAIRNGIVRVGRVNLNHAVLGLNDVGEGFWSQLLSAVTTVIKVMKTAIFIAGAVGIVAKGDKQVVGERGAGFEVV